MISAAIVTFNEANKLEECLKSIEGFVDEIIVVDLGSKDNVKKVCQKYNARLYIHEHELFVEKIRNFSIDKTQNDWILVLDPDERLSQSLMDKLVEIAKTSKYVAVNIPRKNIFFGEWILHTNWWPDRHIRFFKKGNVIWNEKIHSYPIVKGEVLNLDAKEDLAIIHEGYDTISQFIERQNRYSIVEADNLYKDGVRFSWIEFLWKPIREFLVRFVKHAGFMDGLQGFTLTFLIMIYQLMVYIKLWELDRKNK